MGLYRGYDGHRGFHRRWNQFFTPRLASFALQFSWLMHQLTLVEPTI
jgi:hypothetical protein